MGSDSWADCSCAQATILDDLPIEIQNMMIVADQVRHLILNRVSLLAQWYGLKCRCAPSV